MEKSVSESKQSTNGKTFLFDFVIGYKQKQSKSNIPTDLTLLNSHKTILGGRVRLTSYTY